MNAIVHQPVFNTAISRRPVLHVAVIGPAGHGKSALIESLLAETGGLATGDADGKALRRSSHDVLLIDDPDQSALLRDTITGVAEADAAVLVVDASEPGRGQRREHSGLYAHLLNLLGIRQIVVVINKLDRVAYDAGRFREIEAAVLSEFKTFGLAPLEVIPVSARDGEGLTAHTYAAEWYRPTLLEALDRLSPAHAMRKPFVPPASIQASSVA